MARLRSKDRETEVPDGGSISNAAEDMGVPFGCIVGMCGTCQIIIDEGEENLTQKTQAEIDMELEPHVRLACQCCIRKGTVKIRF